MINFKSMIVINSVFQASILDFPEDLLLPR